VRARRLVGQQRHVEGTVEGTRVWAGVCRSCRERVLGASELSQKVKEVTTHDLSTTTLLLTQTATPGSHKRPTLRIVQSTESRCTCTLAPTAPISVWSRLGPPLFSSPAMPNLPWAIPTLDPNPAPTQRVAQPRRTARGVASPASITGADWAAPAGPSPVAVAPCRPWTSRRSPERCGATALRP